MAFHHVALLLHGFLYQPKTGQIWDPSCFAAPNGTYYCVSMYSPAGNSYYTSGWLSKSDDGVHWSDVGAIAPSEPGKQWWKGFVMQLSASPPRWVLNHGVYESGKNDALRILTSTDLLTWTVNATSRPDGRWYGTGGRWDHMYMQPDGKGAYLGFPVSSPLKAQTYARTWPGVQRSNDGVHWTAHAPLNVSWGGVSPQAIEEGGFEALALPRSSNSSSSKRRYFLIGGGSASRTPMDYSMWAFSAEAIDGPYTPISSRFRLSGGNRKHASFEFGALAAWCRGRDGELLISQYMTAPTKGRADVWVLPMRVPVLDSENQLRLGYWKANDALLGEEPRGARTVRGRRRTVIDCASSSPTHLDGVSVAWLATLSVAEHAHGAYLNATIIPSGDGSVGLVLGDLVESGDDISPVTVGATAALLDVGTDGDPTTASRVVSINGSSGAVTATLDRSGRFACGPARECGVATVTALEPGKAHHVLLFFSNSMWELYADGLLVQTYVYGGVYPLPATGAGAVGVACAGKARAAFDDVSIGQMRR